ncbi:MAG: hypothetical protein KAV00_15900 [Phycisphaerae bacterium]|nr:hypothetical protein [Phycisphaerae bacterium]
MRRLIKLILLLAVFLGGYYVGHRPDSPDIFVRAGEIYSQFTNATDDVTARAKRDDVPVTEAAVSYLLESEAARKSAEKLTDRE